MTDNLPVSWKPAPNVEPDLARMFARRANLKRTAIYTVSFIFTSRNIGILPKIVEFFPEAGI
jgi:hypothetical protein